MLGIPMTEFYLQKIAQKSKQNRNRDEKNFNLKS